MPDSILQTAERLRKGTVSPVELTKECLSLIDKWNPVLNAFITITADSALAQAYQAEEEINHGNWRGPLHGIPIAFKDIIDTAGVRTTAASALFNDRIPAHDADVVQRLRNAGAVLVGKQNLHEFAYGGSSVISFFEEVHNPWNAAHIAGGSSGGSAAAVAARLCYAAIGTDTAGSVREPGALCGVVGLKPTYGRVSTQGVIPLSASLDHVGPITRSAADAAVLLQAIATDNHKVGDLASLQINRSSFRIGVPRNFFFEDLDVEIAEAVEKALAVLQTLGNDVRDMSLEVPTDRTLQMAESYAVHAQYVSRSPELYQPETLRRIRNGENITAAVLEEKRRELQQIRTEIDRVFEAFDVLVTPTTPIPAPALDELKKNPDLLRPRELALLRNTRPANVWGLPAISVPCGFNISGLPIGLQIIGRRWHEATVLQLAYTYEQATEWHKRSPDPLPPARAPLRSE